MLSLISIQNKKLNNFQKNNIIHLKNEHWKYSISEHNEYLKKNYKIGDFHNLLFFKKKLIGYTGLGIENLYTEEENINIFTLIVL